MTVIEQIWNLKGIDTRSIMSTVPSISVWNETALPTPAPTIFAPTPRFPNYEAPSTGQVIMYVAIVSITACVITYLNKRNPRPPRIATETAPNTTNNDTTQNQADLVKSMTPEERKEYVTNFLKTQKFVDDHDASNCSAVVSFRVTKALSLQIDSNRKDDDCNDLESNVCRNNNSSSDKIYPSCAICLERFQNGEDICGAQNKDCPHEFHLECLFPWLLKSQECPCCRRDYLSIEPVPTNDEPTTIVE